MFSKEFKNFIVPIGTIVLVTFSAVNIQAEILYKKKKEEKITKIELLKKEALALELARKEEIRKREDEKNRIKELVALKKQAERTARKKANRLAGLREQARIEAQKDAALKRQLEQARLAEKQRQLQLALEQQRALDAMMMSQKKSRMSRAS